MPKRQLLLDELRGETDYGIFLAAQMGGSPNELQFIMQTAQYDTAQQGFRPRKQFTVRALGVSEHRLTLGVFGNLFFADDHPILLHYNVPRLEIHFAGQPDDVNALMLDIHQAYLSTFGPWREMARDLNRAAPLMDLLTAGNGVLGKMPQPAAERMVRVLARHNMSGQLSTPPQEDADEHGRSRQMKLLGIDDAYCIALDFSVEEMGKI